MNLQPTRDAFPAAEVPCHPPGLSGAVREILAGEGCSQKNIQIKASMILARSKRLQRLQLKQTRRRIHV